jgi:polar amino acid transport system substrate-binding protein
LGFYADTASSGKTALEMIKDQAILSKQSQQPYGLVFMDWDMPDINGIETARQIQQNHDLARIPKIVMVTAHSSEDLIGQARQISLDGFLIKPVTQSLLFDAVMNAFGKAVDRKIDRSINKTELPNGFDNIRGSRLLLIEDNAINQQLAVELLGDEGFYVDVAGNGKIGVDMVKSSVDNPYDVVLMDLQMPVMDGRTAARAIRAWEAEAKQMAEGKNESWKGQIPIIAMTADAMAGVKEDVLSIGMNDYVTKPIEPSDVFKALVRWIKPSKRPLPDEYAKKINQKTGAPSAEIEIPHLDGINTDIGLSRVSGNKKLYINLLKKFHRDNQDITQQILTAIQQQDQELAVRLAHTVKGVSGTIGAMVLQTIAGELESALKLENYADHTDLVAKLDTSINFVLKMLESIVSAGTELTDEAKTINQGAKKQGDKAQLTEFLKRLEPFVQKKKPKPCKDIMEEISVFNWSDEIKSQLQELDRLIGKYKFKEALEIVESLINRL